MPKTKPLTATKADVWVAALFICVVLIVFDVANWYAANGPRKTAERIEQKVNQPCQP